VGDFAVKGLSPYPIIEHTLNLIKAKAGFNFKSTLAGGK
jgi:hypothetical protein